MENETDENKDGNTSGSGSSSVEEEHVETSADGHSHPKEVQKRSAQKKEISFIHYQLKGFVFKRGDRVFVMVRLPSHRDIHSLKVVIGWLQRIHREEVIVYCRFGLGRVSKLAILSHCQTWSQETFLQMKNAVIMSQELEELPVMREAFPGSLPYHQDIPSYHSRQPASSSSSFKPTYPSHLRGLSRSKVRSSNEEYNSHRQDQQAANSTSSPVQYQEAALPPQQNGLQGYSWISQVQPTYSPVILSHTPAQSVLVMMPYPSANQAQSQTFYPQPCVSYDYQNCFATYN